MADYSKFDRYAPQIIADLIHDFGLKDFQAAGVAGNGGGESAGFTDIVEDGAIARGWKGGTGWFQDTGSRRTAFEAWIRRKGWRAESYEANYSYLYRELISTERAALQALRQTTSLEEATDVFCRRFERPANPSASMPARIRWAQRALAKYRANPPAPTRWPTDRTPPVPSPAPSPQPTPVPPMPSPAPLPLPETKPWWQSKTVLTNIATLLASMPLFAKYLGGADVSTVTETLSTLAVLAGPIISSLFRRFSDSAITGSPLARQLDAVQGQRDDASYARAQPVREAWNIDQLPAVIQHVTDHQEVMRLATQLPWTEFAALAIKLLPVLTAAKDAAQKVVEQRPPPPPATSDPLDILRQQP
jgi:hypothetical protein